MPVNKENAAFAAMEPQQRHQQESSQPHTAETQLVPSSQRPLPDVVAVYEKWRTWCELSAAVWSRFDAPAAPHDIRHWLRVLNVKLR